MTDQQHPITPPPELVEQWADEWMNNVLPGTAPQYIATQAARWGADQELEACVEWMVNHFHGTKDWAAKLRADRRPKPPSLSEPALQALVHLDKRAESQMDTTEAVYTIRRALEALPND